MSEQRYAVSDFSRIYIESAIFAFIRRSDEYSVTTDGDDFNVIKVEQQGDTLKIRRKGFVALFRSRPSINITAPQLHELVISGASQVKIAGFDSGSSFALKLVGASQAEIYSNAWGKTVIEVGGASNVTGDVKISGDISFNINGASRVELSGSGAGARLELSGASQARLANFTLVNVDSRISGASSAQLKVSGKLDVNLSGASRLEYAGNPTIGNVNISGASTFKQR